MSQRVPDTSSPRINIVGGGPGGLFLAALLRPARPDWQITVWERNAPDATFGFGVVFSDRTVRGLEEADPITMRRIRAEFQSWTDIEVATSHGVARSSGHGFSAIARHRLLRILQDRCRELDVDLRFGDEIKDLDSLLTDSDLIVGSDGLNSRVRSHWAEHFQPDISHGSAYFAWFATPRRYDALTFHFVDSPHGTFATHAYPFSKELSTFIVETDESTWRQSGMDQTDVATLSVGETDLAALDYCQDLFEDSLTGESLVGNASRWMRFPTIRNESWSALGRIVILGDAAHTAHFSVGSGTKMAMEDATELASALLHEPDIATALQRYEQRRRPEVEKIQDFAEPSRGWWEHFGDWVDTDIDTFAVNFLTRTGRETVEHLRRRDSEFVDQHAPNIRHDHPLTLSPHTVLPTRIGMELPDDADFAIQAARLAVTSGAGLLVLGPESHLNPHVLRREVGDSCVPIAGYLDSGVSINDLDLVFVPESSPSPGIPFVAVLDSLERIDDAAAIEQFRQRAVAAQAAGATAIALRSRSMDGRPSLVHSCVVLRTCINVPIITTGYQSIDEVETDLAAGRSEFCVGTTDSMTFPDVRRHLALHAMLHPRAIAVIGASRDETKPGNVLLKNLESFPGPVVGVGRHVGRIGSCNVVDDIADIPADTDLAVLAIPAAAVPAALRQLARQGVASAIVCSGGFAETGDPEGVALQEEITKICRRSGMRVLGPNTSGIALPPLHITASFVPAAMQLQPGSIAVIAQSGGVAHAVALSLAQEGLGLSAMIGVGNGVDIDLGDLIEAMSEDATTRVLFVHLEGSTKGEKLASAISRAALHRPVVVLKSGVSDVDRLAVSHTGALTGEWDVARAVLEQSGAVVVPTMTEAIDAVKALLAWRLSPAPHVSAGVVTGQAGPGILLADRLQTLGLQVPPLDAETMEHICEVLPNLTHRQNPVDTGRPGSSFATVVSTVARDSGIDLMTVYALLEPDAIDLAETLHDYSNKLGKPLLIGTNGLTDDYIAAQSALATIGIPCYPGPDRAATGAWALAADSRATYLHRQRSESVQAHQEKIFVPDVPSDEAQAKDLLESLGIGVPARRVCTSRAGAAQALLDLDGPLAVKILSRNIAHKSHVGGVHLGIMDTQALAEALDCLDRIDISGEERRYLIERLQPPGADLFLSVRRDAFWGFIGVVGIGGTDVDDVRGVDILALPTSPTLVQELLAQRGLVIELAKAREIARIIAVFTGVICANPEIDGIEVNPLRLIDGCLIALDALVLRAGQDHHEGGNDEASLSRL